jgi:hypothetical protein
MSRHWKRPTVLPERASYGTARVCAGIQTSERPIGSTPKLGAELRVWTARMLAALEKKVNGGKSATGAGNGLLSLRGAHD